MTKILTYEDVKTLQELAKPYHPQITVFPRTLILAGEKPQTVGVSIYLGDNKTDFNTLGTATRYIKRLIRGIQV